MAHHHEHGSYTANRLEAPPPPVADDPMLTDMMDYYLVRKSESYKFIRMADDLHDVASYLNEMRICFLLLTGTVYIILAIYFVSWCVGRNRRRVNNPAGTAAGRNRLLNHNRWGGEAGNEFENAVTAQTNIGGGGQQQTEDLVSVRSDGALPGGKVQQQQQHGLGAGPGSVAQFGMAGRGGNANRQQAPSFMRHSGATSMQNHSGGGVAPTALMGTGGTTRLVADTSAGTVTKQQPQHLAQHPHHTTISHQHSSPPSAHSPHHHPQVGSQQSTAHQSGEQQQQHQQMTGRAPGCLLLNNIVEEKEGGSSGSSSANAVPSPMSTFGWRNKEKILMERHELQPLAGTDAEL